MQKIAKKSITKTFDDWIKEDIHEELRQLKQHFNTNQQKEFVTGIEVFTQRIKNELFGHTIVFAVDSFYTTKNDTLIVNAAVMEPMVDGSYKNCVHPLQPDSVWLVSSIIPKDRFQTLLTKGALFEAEYDVQKDPRHLYNIIKFDLQTYREVHETLVNCLNRLGNSLLARAAETLYGSDVEKVITTKFLEIYRTVEKEFETDWAVLSEKYKELEQEQSLYDQQLQQLNEKQQQWKRVLEKIDQYIRLEDEHSEEMDGEEFPWEPEKATEMLQYLLYHNSEDDLVYDEIVIEMFLRALQTNALVILSGPSGTGKSSLVTEIANAIKGAKARIIPVQSSWTDTQDLIGYFNPIDKSFVGTPFMEALADAAREEEKDNLHLICLDEMNLAHVEHYFSEFLSIREQKNPNIQLYNKRFFLKAKEMLDNDSTLTTEQQLIAKELVERYPHKFQIPKNVRFIGTINMDQTVKSLSPKVIDRSFIIEIDHLDSKAKGSIEKKLNDKKMSGQIKVTVAQFESAYSAENVFEKEAQSLIDLSHRLDYIANAPLNSRGKKQILKYLDRVPKQKLTKTMIEKYYDQLIYSKVLPRIEISKRDEQGLAVLMEFQKEIGSYTRSARKLGKMLENERIIRYW